MYNMINYEEVVRNIFAYETPKIVTIRSFVGIISRLMQFSIFLYILVYAIIYRKGYQEVSDIESAVTTKVKGVAFTNFSVAEFKPNLKNIDMYRRIWDVADYVVPPSQTNSIFIATNIHITPNQKRSVCAEDITIKGARCDPNNNTCVAGTSLVTGNGVLTGKCVPFEKSGNYSCQIHAWCPVENDILPLIHDKPLLAAAENFTILIKNYVFFPKFKDSNLRNIREHRSRFYLQNCRYDPVKYSDCPIFKVGDIVKAASYKTFADLGSKGAVIEIRISWNCDLDWSKDNCFPTYEFVELDDPKIKLGKGWNFRYADYFSDGSRTLHKMYGIKFAILVQGQAGKFGILPLLQNMGAGVGLFVVQRVLCDILVLYLVKKGSYYKSKKYETVVVDRDGSAVGINSQPLPHSESITALLRDSSDTQLVTDSSNPKFATDISDPHQVTGNPSSPKTTGEPSGSSNQVTRIFNLHPTTQKLSTSTSGSHQVADKHSFLQTTGKYSNSPH